MSALGELPKQPAVPTTPEPQPKKAKTPMELTGEADHYGPLLKDVQNFLQATRARKELGEDMTHQLNQRREDFADAIEALAISYKEDLSKANADFRATTEEITTSMVQYFNIPVEDPRNGFTHIDRRELVYYLLKDFGAENKQGPNEPGWMWNFTKPQRKAAAILKTNLENSYASHCVTLAMTHMHADFLEKVKDDYKQDYDCKVRDACQTIINQILGGVDVQTDKRIVITKVITIGTERAIYLQTCRVASDALHRPEDAHLQKVQRTFVQEQQNKFHLSSPKRHSIEQTFRTDYYYDLPHNLRVHTIPNGTWKALIKANIEFRFNLQNTPTRTQKILAPMENLDADRLIRNLIDFPKDHEHYSKAPDTERMMLISTGKLLHAPFQKATVQLPTRVIQYDFRVSEELYYFMMNGSELYQMIVHNILPSEGTFFKPYNLNWTYHEAARHYTALWNDDYERRSDYVYLCFIRLDHPKYLQEFNRHYVEYNDFVGKNFVYQLLPRELVTLGVVEYTGKEFDNYRQYINGLNDYWWDHTALIGLADIGKNYALVHALLNCGRAGKFAEYYMSNKLVIDQTIEGLLVDYIDEEAQRNLTSILTVKGYVDVVEKTTYNGCKTYTRIQTTIEQKKAINWILTMYEKKLKDDVKKKTSTTDTPLPEKDVMYSKIEDDWFFAESLTTETLIDPGCASTSLG
jgi:hypothetical protein